MSHIADKLAFENDLCRRTTSVTRDTKRSQLIVVEEIRKNGKDDSYRSEVYYHFADDVENSHVNKIIDTAKAIATFKFLGRRMKDALEVTTAPVAEVVATGEDLGTPARLRWIPAAKYTWAASSNPTTPLIYAIPAAAISTSIYPPGL